MKEPFGATRTADRVLQDVDLSGKRVLIPLIRTAATIGFAVAPCSLGFVIIGVSEQLIRSIMVGDDPEMLVSDLQNQFPNDRIKAEAPDPGLVARVLALIEYRTAAHRG